MCVCEREELTAGVQMDSCCSVADWTPRKGQGGEGGPVIWPGGKREGETNHMWEGGRGGVSFKFRVMCCEGRRRPARHDGPSEAGVVTSPSHTSPSHTSPSR